MRSSAADPEGVNRFWRFGEVPLGTRDLVALKMILAGAEADPHEVARFRREAEAVARLQHPNVVQVYEIDEVDRRPYLALEYVEGGSLARKFGGVPVPAAWAARLVETLARAVHVAHQRGIVHRDLKPANILIADCGLRIADWSGESPIRNPQSPRSPTSAWPNGWTVRRARP
jgi:serine/threonine protein kinase